MVDQQKFPAKIREIVIARPAIMLGQVYLDAQTISLIEESLKSWPVRLCL